VTVRPPPKDDTGDNEPGGLRWQYNLRSNRARTAIVRCPEASECQTGPWRTKGCERYVRDVQ